MKRQRNAGSAIGDATFFYSTARIFYPRKSRGLRAPRPTVETIGVACLCQRVRRDATDRQIDKLVYELYGSTDEEIKIIEGAA